MESAKMTRADRRWVITELFSCFFFATGPENEHDDEEVEEEDDDDAGGDDDDDGGGNEEEAYLELEVEGQDKAAAYSSHCAPRFILLNMCPLLELYSYNCAPRIIFLKIVPLDLYS